MWTTRCLADDLFTLQGPPGNVTLAAQWSPSAKHHHLVAPS